MSALKPSFCWVSSAHAPEKGGLTWQRTTASSIKNDKQYEGLRKKGMSKQRAAKIANSKGSSKRGGKKGGKKSGSKS